MSDREAADLVRLAVLIYVVILPAMIALGLIEQMISEWRMRRRIRRIMDEGRSHDR